jgi:DNA recombination protein RmuC
METAILILLILVLCVQAVLLYRSLTDKGTDTARLEGQISAQREEDARQQAALREEIRNSMQSVSTMSQNMTSQLGQTLAENQQLASANQTRQLQEMGEHLQAQMETMRRTINDQLTLQRQENAKKLEEIRGTVDEQLQTTLEKRIAESFQTVSTQLEQVYKGLGEMKNLASDVGGLKQVLSGVKTRGILGEVQLGAILGEVLAPEQYETNVATIPGSTNRVEFAIRLPGQEGSGVVYLPIDSKFPGDRYAQLQDAQASGDREQTALAWRELERTLCSEAKDIRTKYVEEPYTTGFGILFLPFEGLYAEVVNRGMVERLQREYHVSIAGPSTMAALLNSLQMGFRTLAIQKRSSEVWEVLGSVKAEFGKFEDGLSQMQKHLNQTSNDLEKLMTTRTRAIQRKLRDVQMLESPED